MMPRILYGGTFDPVHRGPPGHRARRGRAATTRRCTCCPPRIRRTGHHPAPARRSGRRCSTWRSPAIERLRVDRRELLREGPSYSVDTLREVRAEIGPDVPLIWVLGIDSLRQLDTWHDWRRIFEFGHVLGVERPAGPRRLRLVARATRRSWHAELLSRGMRTRAVGGIASGRLRGAADPAAAPGVRHRGPPPHRQPWAIGEHWCPTPVAGFIREQRLYRTPSPS